MQLGFGVYALGWFRIRVQSLELRFGLRAA